MPRPHLRLGAVSLLLIAAAGAALAQMPQPSEPARIAPADSAAHLPPDAPRSGWLYVLPVIAYSPETALVFGGSAGRYYRLSETPDSRPTTAAPLALVTTKSQIILSLFTDAWWSHDRWHLASNLGYSKFPTQFYGVGDATDEAAEEDYTPRTGYFELEVTRRLLGALYLGGLLDVRNTSLRDLAEDGALVGGGVFGTAGGTLWGLGATASWDSRDAVFYPTRGWYNRLAVSRYLDVLGGDYVYTLTDASLTHYFPLGGRRVLAANVSGAFITGGRAPFYQLNRLSLRGYFEERYLETHVLRARLAFRTPVWRRLGAVVFTEIGEMASSLDGLRLDEALPSVGFGLRFNVGGADMANIRLDYGWGDGDSRLYIRFGEAF
jgi:outer membrane protein assembly factor BamA